MVAQRVAQPVIDVRSVDPREIVRGPRGGQQAIAHVRLVGPMVIGRVGVTRETVRVPLVDRWSIVVGRLAVLMAIVRVLRVVLVMIGDPVAARVIRDRRVASVVVRRGLANELVVTRV